MTLLDSIDWGTTVNTNNNVINVYFATAGETYDDVTSDGWSAYEIQQAMAALDVFENVISVTFNRVNSPTQSDFQLVTTTNVPYAGYFNPPGTFNAGVVVFATDAWGWNSSGGLEQGGYGFITLVHEFAHGMGLAHPHDNGGTSLIMNGVTSSQGDYGDYDLNQGIFTMLSYNDGWLDNGYSYSENYGWQGTLMGLDIAVLQNKYGANTNYNAGNDTYIIPSSNSGGTYYSAIWDTGGNDTIETISSYNTIIDLRPATLQYEVGGGGYVSYSAGIIGGFTVANGVIIENAIGGSGDDNIYGNSVANLLKGNAGKDTINGNSGNDTLFGGANDDNLYGASGNDKLYGGSGDDYLKGHSGDDYLKGHSGDDYLRGGDGEDTLNGNSGNDTISDFDVSGNEHIDFTRISAIDDISDLSITYTSPDTIISYGSDSITLLGTTAILQADDFLFA